MSEPKFKSIFYVGISTILIIILFAASAYSTEPFNPAMPKALATYHGIAEFTGLRVFLNKSNLQPFNQN